MTGAELWAVWRLWMIVAAAVVAVAAALLITIWLTARSIAAHATRALRAAEAIRASTQPIWALQATNETAEALRDTVRAIEAKSAALAEAVEQHAAAPRR
jgi:hypothetical protein